MYKAFRFKMRPSQGHLNFFHFFVLNYDFKIFYGLNGKVFFSSDMSITLNITKVTYAPVI